MIFYDYRLGSEHLGALLRERGVPAEKTNIKCGDVSFYGTATQQTVGIEVKRISEILEMLKGDTRFVGGQLPGLADAYDAAFLVVQGCWRESMEGLVEVPIGKNRWRSPKGIPVMARALRRFLITLAVRGGLHRIDTFDARETAGWIADLYRWWNDKRLQDHGAHLSIDHVQKFRDSFLLKKPSWTREMMAKIPLIGWERSQDVQRKFRTIRQMANAEKADWMTISGIGEGIASAAVKLLHEGD